MTLTMSAIDKEHYASEAVDPQDKRDPEYAADGIDPGSDSDGVPSFTALIEEGENSPKYLPVAVR
jgi:hypothetical protein